MALFQWDNSYSVKVASADEQHKKIIAIINRLNDAMREGKGKDVLGPIVDELLRYSVTHFSMEEKLFAQHGYPDTEAHKKQHAFFIQKATEFKQDLASGKIGLTIQVMNFLSDWWKNHIKVTDMKYSGFFAERGVK